MEFSAADGKKAVCPYCGHEMLIEKEEKAGKEYERLMAAARAEEDIKDLQRKRKHKRRLKGWLIALSGWIDAAEMEADLRHARTGYHLVD